MKLTCLVDNAVQPNSGFWGEHGLAYLVEAAGQRILFDTGQSGTVLEHNLKLLGIDPATIDAVASATRIMTTPAACRLCWVGCAPAFHSIANADLFRERYQPRKWTAEVHRPAAKPGKNWQPT